MGTSFFLKRCSPTKKLSFKPSSFPKIRQPSPSCPIDRSCQFWGFQSGLGQLLPPTPGSHPKIKFPIFVSVPASFKTIAAIPKALAQIIPWFFFQPKRELIILSEFSYRLFAYNLNLFLGEHGPKFLSPS